MNLLEIMRGRDEPLVLNKDHASFRAELLRQWDKAGSVESTHKPLEDAPEDPGTAWRPEVLPVSVYRDNNHWTLPRLTADLVEQIRNRVPMGRPVAWPVVCVYWQGDALAFQARVLWRQGGGPASASGGGAQTADPMGPPKYTPQRPVVSERDVEAAFRRVRDKMDERLKKKGWGAYSGAHEVYGILAEEFKELVDELQADNREAYRAELVDIAVGCIFGVASLSSE